MGDVLYLSGALGNVPGKMELVPGGIETQTDRAMMENIARVLNANRLSFDDVFKCLVMMKDMNEWAAFNKTYVTYFKPDRLPARSAFGASQARWRSACRSTFEMECWAYAGKK